MECSLVLKYLVLNGAKALGVKKGSLIKDFDADIIGFCLLDKIEEVEDIYMQIILHTKYVDKIVIGGEFV